MADEESFSKNYEQGEEAISRDQVVKAFGQLVDEYRVGKPTELPEEDEVSQEEKYRINRAHGLFERFQSQEKARIDQLDDPEAQDREDLELDLKLATLFVEAGFQDNDYIDEVANDWLINTLSDAEWKGQNDIATKIKMKIFELNKMLPEEWQSATIELGQALEDMLSPEDCAELALMHTIDEALERASELLPETDRENLERLLEEKGVIE